MTYETFLTLCKELDIFSSKYDTEVHEQIAFNYLDIDNGWCSKSQKHDNELNAKKLDVLNNFIYLKHETGGVSGGSCWDESNPQPYHNSEPMPEFDALYSILEKINPQMPFLQVRKILNTLVKSCYYVDREYYGNSTTYLIKYVNLKDLHKFLTENNLT